MPQPLEMQIDVPATENHPLEAQIPGKLACQGLKNATARGGDALRHNEMPDLTYETRHGSHFRAVSASERRHGNNDRLMPLPRDAPPLMCAWVYERRASAQRHTMEAMRAKSDSALTERHKSQ